MTAQDPVGGTEVDENSIVTVTVNDGPEDRHHPRRPGRRGRQRRQEGTGRRRFQNVNCRPGQIGGSRHQTGRGHQDLAPGGHSRPAGGRDHRHVRDREVRRAQLHRADRGTGQDPSDRGRLRRTDVHRPGSPTSAGRHGDLPATRRPGPASTADTEIELVLAKAPEPSPSPTAERELVGQRIGELLPEHQRISQLIRISVLKRARLTSCPRVLQKSLFDLADAPGRTRATRRDDHPAAARPRSLGRPAARMARAARPRCSTTCSSGCPGAAEERQMYDRVVEVPRLLSFYGEYDPLPHPELV